VQGPGDGQGQEDEGARVMNRSGIVAAALASGAAVVVIAGLAFQAPREHAYQPAQDIKDLRCTWAFETHTVPMLATITNSRDETMDYAFRVEYLTAAGKRVGSGDLIVNGVRAGQTASVQGLGDFVPGAVPDRCVIGLE
jgi:hypothetical protein